MDCVREQEEFGQAKRPGTVVVLTDQDRAMLDAFWQKQGVKGAHHRKRLVEMATKQLLFRDPPRLAAQIEILRAARVYYSADLEPWLGGDGQGVPRFATRSSR